MAKLLEFQKSLNLEKTMNFVELQLYVAGVLRGSGFSS